MSKCVKCERSLKLEKFSIGSGGKLLNVCRECRYPSLTMREMLERKVIKKEGCWGWKASLTRFGYGEMHIGKRGVDYKHVNAHRVAYMVYKGEIPKGRFICHTCDNRSCCNPLHLFIGTPMDNMHDMIKKGRKKVLVGSECPWAKINEETVLEVLELCKSGFNCAEIGKKLNICKKQVSDIKRGRRWGHVGDRTGIKKIKANKILLNEEKVREIKQKFEAGARVVDIVNEYGINRGTVDDIKKNKTWKHVKI